ncbi:MAG: hypothetical protein ACRD0K_02235 [Egibacteraceae bacterium]
MSPDTESHVFYPRGPMHTGTGDQFNAPVYIVDQSRERLVLVGEPRAVAREQVCWLHPRFVEPPGYGRARELLADNGSVLLTGPPGSGRRAAAQMLLHRLPDADGLIRELPDTLDSLGEPVLDGSLVEAGERLLLDLSASDEEENGAVLRQLPSYRVVVRERGAHLVVVLPGSRMHHLGLEFGPSVVEIGRPDGMEVFQRYLRSDGIRVSREQLGADELTKQLRSAPMLRIAELAILVHRSRKLEPAQAFPHWLGTALAALTERSDEVAKQVKELRCSGQLRALLLTTAMFSGSRADAVFGATSTLLEAVEQPEDDRPRLEREDLAEQLAEIGAKADDAGRVRFALLAYDRAVRAHFWTNFPGLQDGFRDWVGTAIKQRTLTGEERDAVVARFAEQALRTNRPDDLKCLAERWATRTDPRWPSRFLPHAATALERGLRSDEHHSFFFRRQLYMWSRDHRLSPDLAQVVVQVCSGVLAPTHPQQAVVRLHHILRRHSGVAGESARDALLDLVDRDRRLYRLLLDRATSEPKAEEYEAPDTALFLDLADPARLSDAQQQAPPLIEDETVQAQLVSGWKAALAAPPSPRCADQVRGWLAACEDGRYGELLLDVLVEAGDGPCNDGLGRLHVIARDWAHAPDERRAERTGIAARLNTKIDAALGIDFTDLDPGHRTKETAE